MSSEYIPILKLFINDYRDKVSELAKAHGIMPEIFAFTDPDDVYRDDINSESVSDSPISIQKIYPDNNTSSEKLSAPSCKQTREFAYSPQGTKTTVKTFSEGKATCHLVHLRRHPVGYIKIATSNNKEEEVEAKLEAFSHMLIALMWNPPDEGENKAKYKEYIGKTKGLLKFIEMPSEGKFKLPEIRKKFMETLCPGKEGGCAPCNYDVSICNNFFICIAFYDKDRKLFYYGDFEGKLPETNEVVKDYCYFFHERLQPNEPHCLTSLRLAPDILKYPKCIYIKHNVKLKLSKDSANQVTSYIFPTFYEEMVTEQMVTEQAVERKLIGAIHFFRDGNTISNENGVDDHGSGAGGVPSAGRAIESYYIKEMFPVMRGALGIYIHELYLSQKHNKICDRLKIIGKLNQSLLNEKSRYVICYNTLSAITANNGLGISRAILFLRNPSQGEKQDSKGENALPDLVMAIGSETDAAHKTKADAKEIDTETTFQICRKKYGGKGVSPDCVFSERIMKYMHLPGNSNHFNEVFKTVWECKWWPYDQKDFPHNFAYYFDKNKNEMKRIDEATINKLINKKLTEEEAKKRRIDMETVKRGLKTFLGYLFKPSSGLGKVLYDPKKQADNEAMIYPREKYRLTYLEGKDQENFNLEFTLETDEGLLFPLFNKKKDECIGLLWLDRKHDHNRPIVEEDRRMIVNMITCIVDAREIKRNVTSLEKKIYEFHAKFKP